MEGDTKAPFSIATTPMWGGGRYSTPLIAPLYAWSPQARRHQVPFLSLWYDATWDWTPVFRALANTLLIRPKDPTPNTNSNNNNPPPKKKHNSSRWGCIDVLIHESLTVRLHPEFFYNIFPFLSKWTNKECGIL